MPIEIYYIIGIALVGILFKYGSNLKFSILSFAEYKANKQTENGEKGKKTNIIEISTTFLLIISIIGFSFFISRIAKNPILIIVFLICSLILTYMLTIVFNILNMRLRKKDGVIDKDISYNEFIKILKEEIHKKDAKKKEKLHNKMKDLKESM